MTYLKHMAPIVLILAALIFLNFGPGLQDHAEPEGLSQRPIGALNHVEPSKNISIEIREINHFPDVAASKPSVQATVTTIINGRKNAFFDEKKFTKDWLLANPDAIQSLIEVLANSDRLNSLRVSSSIIQERPMVVIERMVGLDILNAAMTQKDDQELSLNAAAALEQIVLNRVDRKSTEIAMRVLLAEKYDALKALSSFNPQFAQNVLAKINNPKLKNALQEAALAGAVDAGYPHAQAARFIEGYQ